MWRFIGKPLEVEPNLPFFVYVCVFLVLMEQRGTGYVYILPLSLLFNVGDCYHQTFWLT